MTKIRLNSAQIQHTEAGPLLIANADDNNFSQDNNGIYVEQSHSVRNAVALLTTFVLGVAGGVQLSRQFDESNKSFAAAAAASPKPVATVSGPREATPATTPTPEATPAASKTPTATTEPTPTASATPTSKKTQIVFLDPGHSGKNINKTDPETMLKDVSAHNVPETEENYTVALMAKKILEEAGYAVVMSKDGVNDVKSSRDRADEAVAAGADIAVSIHDDHTVSPEKFEAVYPQKVGQYREQVDDNDETLRTTFRDKATACISQAYATLIQKARTESQGMNTKIAQLNFDNRKGYSKGNLSLVQLFVDQHKIPWVYNEMGALVGGDQKTKLSESTMQDYATGIAQGVIDSMEQQDKIEAKCEA
jgi:N-acetylmuramoyl-L-alanine amidase